MIRVVVAEDSVTARMLLIEMFASDPTFQVVGEAGNGEAAVELTKRLRPDVVTMDLRMPGMDGFEATQRIMMEAPTPILIVSSSLNQDDVSGSMRAIRAGALMAVAKPQGPPAPSFPATTARFLATVKALASVKVVGHRLRTRLEHVPPPPPATAPTTSPTIVALAASTGGPGALRQVLDALPYDFPLPIVIVQHLAPGFLRGFAEWLANSCRLRVQVASDGDRITPGTAYIAPEDRHLSLSPGGFIRYLADPPVDGFRPSATVLFESVATSFRGGTLAAILTGMGRDGVCGLRRVHALGGRIIAQDEQTCSVFGMPAAAIEEGLADYVLPISLVPTKLVELVGQELRR